MTQNQYKSEIKRLSDEPSYPWTARRLLELRCGMWWDARTQAQRWEDCPGLCWNPNVRWGVLESFEIDTVLTDLKDVPELKVSAELARLNDEVERGVHDLPTLSGDPQKWGI